MTRWGAIYIKNKRKNEEFKMGNKMNNDYTLNGNINATNWAEFKAAMKEAGINTGTKKYIELAEEYKVVQFLADTEKYDVLVKRINEMSFVATKGAVKGKRIIAFRKMFGSIKHVAGLEVDMTTGCIQRVIEKPGKDGFITVERHTSETGKYKEVVFFIVNNTDNADDGSVEEVNKLSYAEVNRLIDELDKRRTVDIHGHIHTRQVYKAICSVYGTTSSGMLRNSFIKGVINFLVKTGYIRFDRSITGSPVFYLNFENVVKDNGTVIGVQKSFYDHRTGEYRPVWYK